MSRLLAIVLALIGALLLFSYSPLPSGIVRYGFLLGVGLLMLSWPLFRRS